MREGYLLAFASVAIGPSLQIAAIGVGSRFGGTADVHSDQSPLKPLRGFDLRPSAHIFRHCMPINS
jgi:hypothetical protein